MLATFLWFFHSYTSLDIPQCWQIFLSKCSFPSRQLQYIPDFDFCDKRHYTAPHGSSVQIFELYACTREQARRDMQHECEQGPASGAITTNE